MKHITERCRVCTQQGQALAEGMLVLLLAGVLWVAIVQIGQLQDMAIQAQHASRVAAFAAAHDTLATDTSALRQTHFSSAAHRWRDHAGMRMLPDPATQVSLRLTQDAPLPAQAQPGQTDADPMRLRREWRLDDAGLVRAAVAIPVQVPFQAQAGMTTSQSASLAIHGEIKRGSPYMEPQAPLIGGGEAPDTRPGFFTIRRHTVILRDAGHSPDADSAQRRVGASAYAWGDAARNAQTAGQRVQKTLEPIDAAWHRPSPSYDWLMPWAGEYPGQAEHE